MSEFDALEAAQNDTPIEQELQQEPEAKEEAPVEAKETKPEPEVPEAKEKHSSIDDKQHWVPLPHLVHERQEKAALKLELEALQKKVAKLSESQAPEYENDPKAYMDHRFSELEQKATQGKVSPEQMQAQVNLSQTQQALSADDQKARQKFPDYQEAINHVRNNLYYQHLMSGVPEDKIGEVIQNAEMNMAQSLIAQGKSPGEFLYEYATETMGYKGKQPKQETKKEAKSDKLDIIEEALSKTTPVGAGDAAVSEDAGDKDASALDEAFAEAFSYMKK